MPVLKITNRTPVPINVALSILVPIHFHNGLLPQQTWETQVGSVWFKFECREDDGANRYSVAQSAATLGLFSLTGASIAVVALPLAITGLAPIAGSSCTLLTALAAKPLIAAAATPEVLALTTWLATNLTRKTVYQIASEQGLKEDELEQTLRETSTLLDGIQYLCLPTSTTPAAAEVKRPDPTSLGGTPESQAAGAPKNPLLGMLSPEMVDRFVKFYSSKNHQTGQPQPRKPEPETSPIRPSEPNPRGRIAKESPLDSLASVFHDFSRFQYQHMKHKKRKSRATDADPDRPQEGGADNIPGKSLREEHNGDDEWEWVEREMGGNIADQSTFNANETVYIGFNAAYHFDWRINPDRNQNQGTRFRLVDTSNNVD